MGEPRAGAPVDAPDRIDHRAIARWLPRFRRVGRLFRHEVHGLQHIPVEGAGLIVLNHGPVEIGAFLLYAEIGLRLGRHPRFLGERLFFENPRVARILERGGVLEGTPGHARRKFDEGELVAVFPGGAREAWKPFRERATVRWAGREGFARVAFEAGVPIIPVACPASDSLYVVVNDGFAWADRLAGGSARVPIPIFFGLGLLPFPVKLVHHVGAPISTAPRAGEAPADSIARIKGETQAAMESLLAR